MEKYKIPLQWECSGEVEVEAESLDKAIEEVELNSDEIVLPETWEIVEGSVVINYPMIEFMNPDCELKRELPQGETERKMVDYMADILIGSPIEEKEKCGDKEEREARRHLDQLGEGYGEDTEEEMDEEEG